MKTSLGVIALAAAVLAAPMGLFADPLPIRKSGKVLILPNFRTLEGDIENLGDRFRIRRQMGELSIPVDKALYLCADWNDAFAFMSSQANLLDPDERVRLARWCQTNGLYDRALKEIEFALQLRPKDAAAAQLKKVVEQQAQRLESKTAEPIQTTSFAPPSPGLDVGVKTLAMFSARVQPILTNTCASCHIGEKEGGFRLFRVTDSSYRNALDNNLLAALTQIDTENPELSPLLTKAVSRHGGAAKPPLNGRETVPYQTLQAWVELVIETNPHLRGRRVARASVQPREVAHIPQTPSAAPALTIATKEMPQVSGVDTKADVHATAPKGLPALPATSLASKSPASAVNAAAKTGFAQSDLAAPRDLHTSSVPTLTAAPASADPYSPDIFNAKMHRK